MKRLALALLCLLIVPAALGFTALAQDATEAVTLAGAVLAQIGTPAAPIMVTLEPNDARSAACAAPTLPDFVPYVVRPGDRLADLVAGQSTITVTQLAALNCIDDPGALPVGAVIWLPAPPPAVEATPDVAAGATPEITPEATSAVSPEATPEVTIEPGTARIERFTASAESVVNTDSVTFRWAADGSSAYFYLCPVEACVRPQTAAALPLSASISFSGFQYAGTYRYRLDVDGVNGAVTQDVSIDVTCAQDWLGGLGALPLCPEAPARTVFAVWQPFENGVMIWFSDVKQVFVMTNDGRLRVYEDQYVDGAPSPTVIAPNERFTPQRGFGQLWEGLGGADSPLGWGTSQEIGFDGARQAAGHTSYTTYISGPDKIVYAVTQLPGAESGFWVQVGG